MFEPITLVLIQWQEWIILCGKKKLEERYKEAVLWQVREAGLSQSFPFLKCRGSQKSMKSDKSPEGGSIFYLLGHHWDRLSSTAVKRLLNFATGSGTWSGAAGQRPVGSSTEVYVAKRATWDFVWKARWTLGPPDTIHKRVSLPSCVPRIIQELRAVHHVLVLLQMIGEVAVPLSRSYNGQQESQDLPNKIQGTRSHTLISVLLVCVCMSVQSAWWMRPRGLEQASEDD